MGVLPAQIFRLPAHYSIFFRRWKGNFQDYLQYIWNLSTFYSVPRKVQGVIVDSFFPSSAVDVCSESVVFCFHYDAHVTLPSTVFKTLGTQLNLQVAVGIIVGYLAPLNFRYLLSSSLLPLKWPERKSPPLKSERNQVHWLSGTLYFTTHYKFSGKLINECEKVLAPLVYSYHECKVSHQLSGFVKVII